MENPNPPLPGPAISAERSLIGFLAAWLLPGAGHWMLGQRKKAVLYFADNVRSHPGEHYMSFFGRAVRETDFETLNAEKIEQIYRDVSVEAPLFAELTEYVKEALRWNRS